MAFYKSLRNILHGSTTSLDNSRPIFVEHKQLSLLEAPTLSAIRDETDKIQQNKLLITKLKLCSIICDFRLAEQSKNTDEKTKIFNKTSMLHEICTYLKAGYGWHTLEVITQIFDTIASNLFRPIPDSYLRKHLMGVDHIVPITYTIPSWQHLEIIYEIIELTFSNQDINQLLLTTYITKYDFVRNFVYLLNTKDKSEREHIQSVLETFYDEHGNLFEKELILHMCNYCMDFIHYGIGTATGIKSILNIFNSMSLIDLEIFHKILIPLHRLQYEQFRRYEFQLWMYMKRVIEEDETLSLILFRNLLHYWPKTSVLKEQQFLKKCALILDFIDEDIWQCVDEYQNPKQWKLLQAVAYKVLYVLQNANHYKSIIDVLDLIEEEEVQEFIDKYGGKHLWCCIYQSLFDICTYFFYFETNRKTKETMEILREQDDIPMKYIGTFTQIEKGQLRMYPLCETAFKDKARTVTKEQKAMDNKVQSRKQKYAKMRRKAHSTLLYKRVKADMEKKEKERIRLENIANEERKRKESLRKQRCEREMRLNKGISTPQLYNAPQKPNLINELMQKISPKNAPISESESVSDMPQMSLSQSDKTPLKYNIIPKKKQTKLKKSELPKSFFKRSQSSGNVIKNGMFWHRDRPNAPNKGLPILPKSNSDKNLEKLRAKQEKQNEKERKQQLKAERKAEKQRIKDAEKQRKNEEKRVKKELKQREKEMKRSNKGRIRKSVDIDRRSSSISNPIIPKPNSPALSAYNQITNNNRKNHYLNTQYYTPKGKGNNNNKSHKLQFSYSPNATYDPPNIASLPAQNSYNNNSKHRKPLPPKKEISKSRTPPPPGKNGRVLVKPMALDQSHPLHKNQRKFGNKRTVRAKNVQSSNGKGQSSNVNKKKKKPPRQWPPVSTKSTYI